MANTIVKKAIIPIAGFGTRFLPATKSVPKSMFPIIDRPVIHYLVEEAVLAGCEEIIIVLSRFQESVREYFSDHPYLMDLLKEKGKVDLIEPLEVLSKDVKFHFVYQENARGDGHAIMCAKEYLGDDPCLVLFGDDIVDPPISKDLVSIYQETGKSVIALEEVDPSMVSQYGICKPGEKQGDRCAIEDLVEKPNREEAPSNLGVVGKYVITPGVVNLLSEDSKSKDGEIRLVEALKKNIHNETVFGYIFPGKRYDIGNPRGLLEATIDFAMKDKELSDHIKKHVHLHFIK